MAYLLRAYHSWCVIVLCTGFLQPILIQLSTNSNIVTIVSIHPPHICRAALYRMRTAVVVPDGIANPQPSL